MIGMMSVCTSATAMPVKARTVTRTFTLLSPEPSGSGVRGGRKDMGQASGVWGKNAEEPMSLVRRA
jgi:hypothetical protein